MPTRPSPLHQLRVGKQVVSVGMFWNSIENRGDEGGSRSGKAPAGTALSGTSEVATITTASARGTRTDQVDLPWDTKLPVVSLYRQGD